MTVSQVRPLTLRLVLALALFPIVPSSALVLTAVIEAQWGARPRWFDELQFWMLAGTVGVTLISLWIWRTCVVWTAGRYAGTITVTAVPLAQVLWWHPLWQAGCVTDDVLRVAQSTGMVGLWVWVTVWVWWGWGKLRPSVRWRLPMSESARRVVLSFGTVPVVVGAYLIIAAFFEDIIETDSASMFLYDTLIGSTGAVVLLGWAWFGTRGARPRIRFWACTGILAVAGLVLVFVTMLPYPDTDAGDIARTNLLAAAIAVALWVVIWRPVVVWDARAHAVTAVSAGVLLALALACPMVFSWGSSWPDVLSIMLPIMAWGGWMIATMLIWRFREAALPVRVDERLRCRACEYHLRGLYTTRCPECGAQPTLDELVAAIVGADDA